MRTVCLCVYVHAVVGWLAVGWGGTAVGWVSFMLSLLRMDAISSFLIGALWLAWCRFVNSLLDCYPVKSHNITAIQFAVPGKEKIIAYKSSVNLGLPSENLGGLSMPG